MTDERAKEIAEEIRATLESGGVPDTLYFAWLLHLYDDVQAIKSAMTGLAHFGIGGSIKRGGE